MVIALPQLKGAKILTHSRMQCFKTCRRQHLYRYELGIRAKRAPGYYRIGGAIHLALDARAKGSDVDRSIDTAMQCYAVYPDWCKANEQMDDWNAEMYMVQAMLELYFWYWEREQVPADLRIAEYAESEQVFDMPITNPESGAATPSFSFGGKRDQIVILGDGRRVLCENKTTGDEIDAESDYWLTLGIDGQISGYFISARHDNQDITDVLYNVLRKPKLERTLVAVRDAKGLKIVQDAGGVRQCKKDGEPYQSVSAEQKEKGWTMQRQLETPHEFAERVRADIIARPEHYFQRRSIPRLNADLDEFRTELWQQQQAIRHAQQKGHWFRNSRACVGFGRCEYITICHNATDVSGDLPEGFERVTDIHPELTGEEE